MRNTIIILILIWMHFLGDFLFQSDNMALNKSKSFQWLGIHSLVYALFFWWTGIIFAIIVGVTHFIVDGITSRVTGLLWEKGERHWFFTLIGLDQAIHLSILVGLSKILPVG